MVERIQTDRPFINSAFDNTTVLDENWKISFRNTREQSYIEQLLKNFYDKSKKNNDKYAQFNPAKEENIKFYNEIINSFRIINDKDPEFSKQSLEDDINERYFTNSNFVQKSDISSTAFLDDDDIQKKIIRPERNISGGNFSNTNINRVSRVTKLNKNDLIKKGIGVSKLNDNKNIINEDIIIDNNDDEDNNIITSRLNGNENENTSRLNDNENENTSRLIDKNKDKKFTTDLNINKLVTHIPESAIESEIKNSEDNSEEKKDDETEEKKRDKDNEEEEEYSESSDKNIS